MASLGSWPGGFGELAKGGGNLRELEHGASARHGFPQEGRGDFSQVAFGYQEGCYLAERDLCSRAKGSSSSRLSHPELDASDVKGQLLLS
jgi:hypothetical protein